MNSTKWLVDLSEIKGRRSKNDLTQNDVALVLSINRTSYIQKENGSADFTAPEIATLAELFNVSPGSLYKPVAVNSVTE